eukprot:m.133703 g.133703  ORF g.133703 m.133703 type:complete len:99 (+) comp14678_c1_seq2:1809-2105(+)
MLGMSDFWRNRNVVTQHVGKTITQLGGTSLLRLIVSIMNKYHVRYLQTGFFMVISSQSSCENGGTIARYERVSKTTTRKTTTTVKWQRYNEMSTIQKT